MQGSTLSRDSCMGNIWSPANPVHRMLIISGQNKYSMASFAITLYGQYCRRHVVGRRVVSDISVVLVTSS